jgi:RHS repeat-associated protein
VAGSGQPSKYTFTGHYDFMAFGLIDMQGRMYSPILGRFLSADTIVPNAAQPQDFNRYSFVRNNPLKYVDPSGHDLALVSGQGDGIHEAGGAISWAPWIAIYKGWTLAYAQDWTRQWDAADASARTAMEKSAGVTFIRYTSSGRSTDEDVINLQKQLDSLGFKDVTLVGISKGAAVVANYISYKHRNGFASGPDVQKFVIVKAPRGAMSEAAGITDPGLPFSDPVTCNPFCTLGRRKISDFTGGRVANVYGEGDWIGSQGYLEGAAVNIVDQSPHYTNLPVVGRVQTAPHGYPSMAAVKKAFVALRIAGDHGASQSIPLGQ